MSIKFLGLNSAHRYLSDMNKGVKTASQTGVGKATLYLESEVVQDVSGHRGKPPSVKTSRFLTSITHKIGDLSGQVFTPVPYAVYLEYGTVYIAPRRHFNDSLDRSRVKIKEFINDEVVTVVRSVVQ